MLNCQLVAILGPWSHVTDSQIHFYNSGAKLTVKFRGYELEKALREAPYQPTKLKKSTVLCNI